jgi:hypothetical protein
MPGDSMGRGLRAGLLPVALWLVVVALTVVAAIIVQLATAGQDFGTRQQTAVIAVGAGLMIGYIVYTIFCVRGLRHVGAWQRAGESATAAGALWGLGIGALIVVLPLILGAVLPQHPSPLLPQHPLG